MKDFLSYDGIYQPMNFWKIVLPALGLGLFAATTATAQDIVIPDRARLQTMSQEEYSAYREQIQIRVDGMSVAERNLMGGFRINSQRQIENHNAAGAYGQGYGSRSPQGGGRGSGNGRGGGGRGR